MTKVFADGRRERSAAFWPEPELFADSPPVKSALEEARSLAERATSAKQNAVEAKHATERAEAGDRQSAADAVRAGTQRPKPKRPAAEKKQAELEREADILATAASDAASAALEALAEHGPGLAAKLETRRHEQVEALVAAVAEVERRHRELGTTSSLVAYLQAPQVRAWTGADKFGLGPVPLQRTSEAPRFGQTVAVLRAAAEAERSKPEAEGNVRPLQQHPMRGAAS